MKDLPSSSGTSLDVMYDCQAALAAFSAQRHHNASVNLATKAKANKWDDTGSERSSEGDCQRAEKAAYSMGESICKPHIWEGINTPNI